VQEIDPISSEILIDFKRWADAEFGSVKSAFSVFDYDKSRSLSLREWRRCCRIYGYDGCARLIFRALDTDGSGTLSLNEIIFLDGWMMNQANSEADFDGCSESESARRGSILDDDSDFLPRLPAPVLREIEEAAMLAMDVLGDGKPVNPVKKRISVAKSHRGSTLQPHRRRSAGSKRASASTLGLTELSRQESGSRKISLLPPIDPDDADGEEAMSGFDDDEEENEYADQDEIVHIDSQHRESIFEVMNVFKAKFSTIQHEVAESS
jgi:hypothetical protein